MSPAPANNMRDEMDYGTNSLNSARGVRLGYMTRASRGNNRKSRGTPLPSGQLRRTDTQSRVRPPARRGLRKRPPGLHPLHLFHPRFSPHVTTSNLGSKPYLVVRDKTTFTISRPLNTVFHSVLLGAWFDDDESRHISPAYAIHAGGAQVPGAAGETFVNAINVPPNLRARARLHRLAVRVTNTGSTGASAIPDGKLWIGTARGVIDRKAFATWNDLGIFLTSRSEATEYSNYRAFTRPLTAVTSPGDFIEYESFNDVGAAMSGTCEADHSLNQVFICLGPNTSPQSFDFSVDAEWTIEYQADPILQSLHSTHRADVAADSVWQDAKAFVADNSGVIEDVAGLGALAAGVVFAPEGAGAALAGFGTRAMYRNGGRAAAIRALGVGV